MQTLAQDIFPFPWCVRCDNRTANQYVRLVIPVTPLFLRLALLILGLLPRF